MTDDEILSCPLPDKTILHLFRMHVGFYHCNDGQIFVSRGYLNRCSKSMRTAIANILLAIPAEKGLFNNE